MFEECNSITSIILSKYDIINSGNDPIDISFIFDKCSKLTYLDISCFNNQTYKINENIFDGLPSSGGTIKINENLSEDIKDKIPKNWIKEYK